MLSTLHPPLAPPRRENFPEFFPVWKVVWKVAPILEPLSDVVSRASFQFWKVWKVFGKFLESNLESSNNVLNYVKQNRKVHKSVLFLTWNFSFSSPPPPCNLPPCNYCRSPSKNLSKRFITSIVLTEKMSFFSKLK